MLKRANAFTLSEVLITLAIIGIVAVLTIPSLMQSYQEKQMVSRLIQFSTTLQQAVILWKEDNDCTKTLGICLLAKNLPDDNCSTFDSTILKYLKVAAEETSANSVSWLPDQTRKYNGDPQNDDTWSGVSNESTDRCRYLLQDGTTISVDPDQSGFWLFVDVNGVHMPNRFGKDTFPFAVGYTSTDVNYPYKSKNDIDYVDRSQTDGRCGITWIQDPQNVDPRNDDVCLTSYVMLNHKLPDFNALSKAIPGFQP